MDQLTQALEYSDTNSSTCSSMYLRVKPVRMSVHVLSTCLAFIVMLNRLLFYRWTCTQTYYGSLSTSRYGETHRRSLSKVMESTSGQNSTSIQGVGLLWTQYNVWGRLLQSTVVLSSRGVIPHTHTPAYPMADRQYFWNLYKVLVDTTGAIPVDRYFMCCEYISGTYCTWCAVTAQLCGL